MNAEPVSTFTDDARLCLRELTEYAAARWRLVDAVRLDPRDPDVRQLREDVLRAQVHLDAALARAGGQVPL